MTGQARPASTVILLRDGDEGIETFLMRRSTTMAFAPRMHVYPGGRVDEADYSAPIDFTVSASEVDAMAQRASSDASGLLALYSCAIREIEEEVGVTLAAVGNDGRRVVDPRQLPIIDHWVTPELESKRYDVRFFAAVLPDGEDAALSTTEADGAFWIAPASALAARAAGEMAMLPPTEATLRYLTSFERSADVVTDGARRTVVPLLPRRLVDDEGKARWVMVHDRTGEILMEDISAPHTRETDGLTFPEHLR